MFKRRNAQEWKQKAFKRFGKRCACCFETCIAFLTFDHIHGQGAAHRRSFTSTVKFYQWCAESPEAPQRVRLFCMNCNWASRYGPCPHESDEFYNTPDIYYQRLEKPIWRIENPKASVEISKQIAQERGNLALAKQLE